MVVALHLWKPLPSSTEPQICGECNLTRERHDHAQLEAAQAREKDAVEFAASNVKLRREIEELRLLQTRMRDLLK